MTSYTDSPKSVACVIPTHNRDETLSRALRSVYAQSHVPTEVIVVDDIGSDSTRDLVGAFPGARYIDGSANTHKSAGASRNLGANQASSEILAFLDDDDFWHADFLEKCLLTAKTTGTQLSSSWSDLYFADGSTSPGSRIQTGIAATGAIPRNPGITGSNFIINRSAFLAIQGFDETLWVANDLDFFVRFLDAFEKYSVNEKVLVSLGVDHGDGHLTSRGPRHAMGISRYLAKYGTRLTWYSARALRRRYHLASRFPEQKLVLKIYHFVAQTINSSPSDIFEIIQRRVRGKSRLYR